MFDGDGNLYALERYMSNIEDTEEALECFWNDVKSDTKLLESIIDDLYRYAKSYEIGDREYDFTEEVDEYIKSLV